MDKKSINIGGEFTYTITGSSLTPDRTNRVVSKGQFEQALALVPLPDTTVVQHLQAPSYIFALMMDPRIRHTDW